MTESSLTFNLDAISEPAAKGIARAYVFAGLGLNAADDARLSNFHLPGKGQIRFVPDAPSPEVTAGYKQEFSVWIIANALREATETFGIFLDRLFEACLVADDAAKRRVRSHSSPIKVFEHAGVDGKLQRLFHKFGIKTGLVDEFQSLTKARNCLSHRRGVVGPEDCTDPDKTKLLLQFCTFEVFVRQPDGSELMLTAEALNQGGVVAKDGGLVAMRLAARQVEFPLGSVLRLQSRDLTGVFVTFWTGVQNLRTAFIKLIERLNSGDGASADPGLEEK